LIKGRLFLKDKQPLDGIKEESEFIK